MKQNTRESNNINTKENGNTFKQENTNTLYETEDGVEVHKMLGDDNVMYKGKKRVLSDLPEHEDEDDDYYENLTDDYDYNSSSNSRLWKSNSRLKEGFNNNEDGFNNNEEGMMFSNLNSEDNNQFSLIP